VSQLSKALVISTPARDMAGNVVKNCTCESGQVSICFSEDAMLSSRRRLETRAGSGSKLRLVLLRGVCVGVLLVYEAAYIIHVPPWDCPDHW
jgi:hypothetical protein